MEAKDFFLLMLIPLLLIGLVVYTDNNKITGAVIAENKDSNIAGTYSVNPSFKAKIDYDFDDYSKIKNSLGVISSCAQGKDVQSCLNDMNNGNFIWELGCDKGAEKVLYDFAEFFQDCVDSADINCLCRKNMDIKKEDIKDYLPPTNKYSFDLTEEPSLKKISIEIPNLGLVYTINTNGLLGWIPKRYSLGYDKNFDILNFNLFFINEILNSPIEKTPYSFGPTQQIIIYKNQLKNSIDFVKQENDNLKDPKDQIIADANNKPVEVSKLSNCNIKPKNMYRFCVTKKDFSITAYDKADGQVKQRSVTIKFAAYIPPNKP